MLKVETARVFPGLRPNVLVLPHDGLLASSRLYRPASQSALGDGRRVGYQKSTNWLWLGFKNIQGFFTDKRFIFLKAKDKSGAWKLDQNPAWALDNGKALDALVRHDLLHSRASL